ncbi:hypothetical protein AZE42_06002 [Rhizopogon vesiculosus]|uniref:F-box domain-containing protein n=1 Tax=Rhizopogon vesiculosus TaxID=180088 RepID=A0A1J8Q9H4_9AGAM|nr:hypothetical protein AZE42_06002 [Rhizopogon vesiculosus]
MEAIEGTTANASDIITALSRLAHSRVFIPDLETPYSAFPNTDHSVSGQKDLSISAVVAERQQQLDAVSQEISDLEIVVDRIKANLIQKLVENHDNIMQSIILHKGLTSTLWRFPFEVLSHIFIHCLPETKYLSPAARLAPMLLTRVCRRWRDVALGTPSLWCRLSVEAASHSDWQRAVFCYDSWLQRSGSRPLSLKLLYSVDNAADLRILLQPYNTRISSLHTTFEHAPTTHLLQDLPVLQELTIRHVKGNFPGSSVGTTISRLSPALCSLDASEDFHPFDSERLYSFNPGWTHLTNVKIVIYQPNVLSHLLHLCPNLSSLHIRIKYGDVIQPLEPFTHANLETLFILCRDSSNPLAELLHSLTLPNLRSFYWIPWVRIGRWPHEEFKAFLARSDCSLDSLILDDIKRDGPTEEEGTEYVTLLPSFRITQDTGYGYLQYALYG